jgi:hypothetical protein
MGGSDDEEGWKSFSLQTSMKLNRNGGVGWDGEDGIGWRGRRRQEEEEERKRGKKSAFIPCPYRSRVSAALDPLSPLPPFVDLAKKGNGEIERVGRKKDGGRIFHSMLNCMQVGCGKLVYKCTAHRSHNFLSMQQEHYYYSGREERKCKGRLVGR